MTTIYSLKGKFSFFQFIEEQRLGEIKPLRRCCSYARECHAAYMSVEEFTGEQDYPEGIAEDNAYLRECFPDYRCGRLLRLAFWEGPDKLDNSSAEAFFSSCKAVRLLGYAVIKEDVIPSIRHQRAYLFEEVFQPSQRPEVYLHGCGEFAVSINGFEFRCRGVLFAQQNLITSCCAQVALRALLQTGGGNTVSYKKINEAAGITVDRIRDHYRARCGEMPRNDSQMLPVGMSADMIHRVLRGMGMNFFHTDYSITADRCADRLAVEKLLAEDHEDNGIRAQRHLLFRRTSSVEEELAACRESFRQEYPYFQSVYMGIEGGYGALLEFRVDRENKNDYCESHILPLFGHNLEQDAWLPQTAFGYFGQKTVGDVRYLSSAQWVTQIIGHDDNFGQNFAFARHSIGGEHILRVWELAHEGVAYSGVNAERYAWQALSSVLVDISLDFLPRIRIAGWSGLSGRRFRSIPLQSISAVPMSAEATLFCGPVIVTGRVISSISGKNMSILILALRRGSLSSSG